MSEHRNRDIKPLLDAYARPHSDWDALLDGISFALRTSANRSTDFTPAFLMFGREMNTRTGTILMRRSDEFRRVRTDVDDYARRLRERLANAIKEANRSREKARASQRAAYNRAHRDVHFQVGDTVLKRSHALSDATVGFAAGLAPKWVGPFQIAEKLSRLTYQLKYPRSGRISGPIHVVELKQYFQTEVTVEAETPPAPDGAEPSGAQRNLYRHRYNTRSQRARCVNGKMPPS